MSFDRRSVLLVTTIGSFLTPFMGASINIALPSIGSEFAIDAILLSWITISFLLASAISLVPFGRLADIHGRKKVFIYGMMIYTFSSFLLTVANSAIILILLRILQGIGGAMIYSTAVAILTSAFPIEDRGKVLGINVASVYLGLSLGPFLGGFLTQNFGWRSIFFVNIPLGLFILLITKLKLKREWAEAKGERFDFIGSIIYGFTLLTIISGFSLLPSILGLSLILIGALGVLIFIKFETNLENPIFNFKLFKNNTVFTFSNLAALINYSATFAVSFLLSLYLQYIKGLNPQNAGLILIAQPFVQAIFSPLAGKLSDKIEPRIVASIGMGLTTIGLFILTFINERTILEFILINLITLGLGFALFSSPNTNAVMSSVDKRFYGVASATIGTMRLIGQVLSMGIVTLVFAIYMGRVQITFEYYQSFLNSIRIAFTIFTTLCFLGIFASLARGELR
ncbi:MAG: MFS transporter [Nitrososphaerales archaeon]